MKTFFWYLLILTHLALIWLLKSSKISKKSVLFSGFKTMEDTCCMKNRPITVVLCHFGGPTKADEVGPFLSRLFNDDMVISLPYVPFRGALLSLLAKRIVKKRLEETIGNYEKIGFSPINKYTDIQADHLLNLLKEEHSDVEVLVVNRYTAPFAADVVKNIDFNRKVYTLTLYPHFAHATSGSAFRDFDRACREHHGDVPSQCRVYSWWHHESYRELCWGFMQEQLKKIVDAGHKSCQVVFSAHGLPQKYVLRGDPYYIDIRAHFDYLKERSLEWLAEKDSSFAKSFEFVLSFQSRVGAGEWIRPYTEDVLETKAQDETLLMVPISFVSDHIETLYEMDMLYKDMAFEGGFKHYFRVSVPNEDQKLAKCLRDVLRTYGLD